MTSVDGKTAYYFDVDTWKPDGESCIWVRLPRAKSDDQFNLFYGKASSASQASSANTWSDYTGVWHMSEQIESAGAASTKSKNATGDTAHDAKPKHGSNVDDDKLAQMVSAEGMVGLARVNGTENGDRRCYLSVPSYTGVGDTFTISGWFKANAVSGYPRLLSRKEGWDRENGFECEMGNNSKTSLSARGASGNPSVAINFPDITESWVHITLVYSGDTLTGYANGTNSFSGTITAATDNGLPLSFGNNSNGSEASFNGKYDEIRLRKGALSATRVAAEYATMTDAGFLVCDGVASTSPDVPVLSAASVEWLNDATTVSLTLDAGVGEASVVFTNILTGADYTVTLAAKLDARSGAVSPTYTLTAEQLPRDATYTWFVRVSNSNFERPAQIAGNAKYYSGAANQTVRYVAKTGSDDNNGMLPSTAKETLTAAIADLGEVGGTVYIDDGDYAFTSDTDTAVTITTPVKVIGLSRDATKVTITRTGKPERVFNLKNAKAALSFVTVYGGKSANGASAVNESGSMEDCVIRDSQRENWDCFGAVYLKSGRIARCLFTGNIGGGSYATAVRADGGVVENSLFTGNNHTDVWTGNGGIVMVYNEARLVNCTIAGNTGGICSGVKVGSNAKAINCAIFGNTTQTDTTGHGHIWYGTNSSDSFVNCAADGEINDACFVVQPGFRDAALHDYSLTPASGLIDQGLAYDGTDATSTTDFAGGTRKVGNVDIGCYEYAKSGFDVGFAASAHEGLLPGPVAVTFTATVFPATEPASYAWDFDNDDTTDEITTTPTVTHNYETAGVKSIRLTATSGNATASVVLRDAVKVSPAVVYANSANAANAHFPYDTPETATPDLAEAIEIAGNGSTILVADGTYTAEGTYGFSIDKALRVMSVSGNPAGCILSSQGSGTHRTVTVNNPDAIVAGFTIRDGYIGSQVAGASLLFRDLGGMVSNCVVSLGRSGGLNGDGALAAVAARGRLTHSILEQGLCNGDQQKDQKTACVTIWGLVDNCLIRDFNRGNDNQNIVMVHSGGKLLNCTIVNGLCNTTTTKDGGTTDCVAVRAGTGARVENCAIAGVRHDNGDDTFSVRAWNGDANCFTNCATDTESPINESCITITTEAFRNYANADYRAAGAASPLVNAGVNNELADGTDFTGGRRKAGKMDIGCYECLSGGLTIQIR